MSLKGSKKVETNRYELDITVSAEDFNKAIDEAYRRDVGKINIQGFRKGKAPKKIIEKFYGENVFFEDALNILYPQAVEDAIAESGLEFIDDKIDFDLVSMDKENGVEFKVVITVKPEVEIDGYKGLKAERVTPKVTDEEVDAEISRMADRNARVITVEDRAAENGDIADIDFDGYVDGKAFDGGKAEHYSLTLGSGAFIPGFEDQIVGHNAGDEFDVNVKFPEDYNAEELKGKDAVFKVKLHEIKKRELPEVDDEFAKDVSEFDTIAELKADLKKKAEERKAAAADADAEDQIVKQLADLLKAEIPQAMIDKKADQSVQDFGYKLQMQGMNLDTYMKYTGSTVADLKKNLMPQAEMQVKIRLALEKIAALEKLSVSEEDINAEYEKLALQYSMKAEDIKNYIPSSELEKDLLVSKALDFVKAEADIADVEAKSEEKTAKAAKKPAAKKTATKSTAAKKTATKKTAESTTEKKAPAKKAAAKTGTAKTTAAKSTAKKAATKTKKADETK